MRPTLFCLIFSVLAFVSAFAQEADEANYDEDKVPVFTLPSILECRDGTKVENSEQWETIRRPELLEDFNSEVYGRMPQAELEISYKVLEENGAALGGTALRRQTEITLSGCGKTVKALLLMYLPAGAEGPVPVFLHYNFQGNHTILADPDIIPSQHSEYPRANKTSRWAVEKVISAGYGLVTMHFFDFYPDKNGEESFSKSVLPLMGLDSLATLPSDGAAGIATWAWGYSRILDYLETVPEVDASKVIVGGHSRLGKVALLAGATDERFAMVISNDSGCGGAALSRREFGETVNRINKVFPYWFCRNFSKCSSRVNELPVDQHELAALVAPRPLYIASAVEDLWADPRGEYLSAYYACEAYALYGYEGFSSEEMPSVDSPIRGRVGYHVRSGGHDVKDYDWECFIAFADKWLRGIE